MNKKQAFFSIFIFFLCIAAFPKGSAEKDYAEGRALLDSSKNTAALESIVQVMENKPESMEAGINLARKTMKNQMKFQNKLEEFIDLLKNDPTNSEKRLALIKDIEALEADMDPELHDFLNKVKFSSMYAIKRIKFNDIMSKGIALITEKEYTKASNTFISGFSIYDGDIISESNNQELWTIIKKQLDIVRADVKKYEGSYSEFISAANKYYSKAFSTSAVSIEKEVEALQNTASNIRSIISSTVKAGSALKKIYLDEAASGADIDETLLPFAYRLTIGRDSAQYYEGVEGSMEAGMYDKLSSLADKHWDEIKRLWIESCDTFNFETDMPIEKNISLINLHLKNLNGLYSLINIRSNSRFSKTVDTLSKKRVSLAQLSNIINSTKNYYSRFLSLKKEEKLFSSSSSGNSDELRNPENIKVTNLKSQTKELESMIDSIKKLSASAYPHKENDLVEEEDALHSKYDLFLSNLNKTRLSFYEELAIINNKAGYQAFSESKQKYEAFKDYLVQKNMDEKVSVSPEKAREELTGLRDVIKSDIRLLNKFIKETGLSISEQSNIFAENKTGIEKTVTDLEALFKNVNSDLAQAESILLKIQLAKNEADLRYEEAVKNLKAGNFTSARRNIELSRTRTNDSLALEENSEYRKMTDERLEKLGKEISDAENAVVVKDVREYLERAKKDYFNGEFERAEVSLTLAKSRWAVTNVEPNEEVENWIAIVNTAGTLKTGRTIPVSAPLYPQMIQLLNNANQLYLDAESKIKSGKRNEALKNLNQANENIKQVLLLFPYNEVAGQLSLKIDKLLDPENFNEQFKKKVETVRSGYKTNSQKAYSNLLDLYGMDKNFPGLAALKNEIEIYLGIKLPPPNLKAISDSDNLTKSAEVIYKSGDKLSFPIAIQQLDTAIQLNKENTAAIQLKDTIRMAMGGDGTIVLSAADEAKYQQAVSELQKGNRVIAAALVEQLMQSPNAKNSAKVRELKKRIDALL